jgi:hypothetical protein
MTRRRVDMDMAVAALPPVHISAAPLSFTDILFQTLLSPCQYARLEISRIRETGLDPLINPRKMALTSR